MLNKQEFSQYIREFNFRELFNEMGWNNDRTSQPITIDEQTFTLQSVAEKSGFKILICSPSSEGIIPDYNTRKKIETKVTKLFQEHLIIFQDAKKTEQIWQLVVRQTGKPTKVTETRWNNNQSPELLFQRAAGIFFEIDEEDHITIVDVTKRIAENFHQNAEKVTKQFYDKFKREHGSFYDFLTGIDDHIDDWNSTHPRDKKDNLSKQWYVSLMLNRLMFCYFIQKKGFLDNNKNYLRDKLRATQAKKGQNQYYSFYRNFLLELFHRGLGEPNHKDELKAEIGRIPYLNGGLFDEHELEDKFKNIQIDDKAFERIFDFFDQYEWHLDTRVMATGKDINPDVIGYIFEKYINDRAQMGAYYTKEDITEYISKNCVLPFLFDETKRNYPNAFSKDSEIWEMLKTSIDRYIYDAVKHGVDEPFPAEIEIGLEAFRVSSSGEKIPVPNLLERRKDWNKSAPETHALPTEIWREVIDRRNRYAQARAKIERGEITGINDFITFNLNIRQFAQDVIENTNDAEFLKAFYKALNSVTIIDPTCGSGAFLFAAMNILEPLYEACLQRMRNFIEDEDRRNLEDKQTFAHKFKYFREVLEDVQSETHPNLQYFVFKSIILLNLYGVDIMNEAVEIAKLRLFLKLVATVEADFSPKGIEKNLGLEPLPDIDFNIRAGNTLIGFATEADLDNSLRSTIEGLIAKSAIMEKMEIVAMAFERYKTIQLSEGNDFADFKDAKNDLNNRLNELNKELSGLLHGQTSSLDYDKWHDTHQPFHWFAEFYEIIHDKGGFDVIIGNPPYVEYSKVDYRLDNYTTIKCGNLYAFIIEKCLTFNHLNGRFGMIVPISSICTDRMLPYQELISSRNSWNSVYAERPSKLFTGAEIQLVITLIQSGANSIYSTTYNKWGTNFRDYLFESLSYTKTNDFVKKGSFPKIGSKLEKNILRKMYKQNSCLSIYQTKTSGHFISYRNAGGRYYKVILNYEPEFKVNGVKKRSSTYQFLYFPDERTKDSVCSLMNSSLFFLYWLIYSDTWHLVNREIGNFPVELNESLKRISSPITASLMEDLADNAIERRENRNKGQDFVEFTQFNARESKPILDEIDKVLAEHYGFTEEELDFIINYDIKYRMGKELDSKE